MGVSILLGDRSITPGGRSMMAQLLREGFGDGSSFVFDAEDIKQLRRLKRMQMRGRNEPPFDYAKDIADSFEEIIKEVKVRGYAPVRLVY